MGPIYEFLNSLNDAPISAPIMHFARLEFKE
jgi:hypothetical protein